MIWIGWTTVAAGFVPLCAAWRANRRTSLRDAVLWAAAGWAVWGAYLLHRTDADLAYLALCFTGCAGVAVLGARRPHVLAWNFVVLGLLGVMALPLLEGMVVRVESFNFERRIFLAGVVAVTVGNYLPTRFAPAAVSLGVGCALAFARAVAPDRLPIGASFVEWFAVGMTPWLGWFSACRRVADVFDREWLDVRDRFGFLWGSRMREQFNAAADNANLPVRLEWSGLRPKDADAAVKREAIDILRKVARRFVGDAS